MSHKQQITREWLERVLYVAEKLAKSKTVPDSASAQQPEGKDHAKSQRKTQKVDSVVR